MIKRKTNQLVLAGLFTALTSIGAFIKIPFPVVPLTLQSFFAILSGTLLFPQYAALSQIAYVILGLAGLPIFANGGGFGYVLQPTFGYLLSLPLGAYFVSKTLKRLKNIKTSQLFLAVLFGLLLILFFGSFWMFVVLRITVGDSISILTAFSTGAFVFLPGTLLKAIGITIAVHYMRDRMN